MNSTKSKRPVSTQFHESTVDEIVKVKPVITEPIQNDDTENKENESKKKKFLSNKVFSYY
jgi:hypothetical protein